MIDLAAEEERSTVRAPRTGLVTVLEAHRLTGLSRFAVLGEAAVDGLRARRVDGRVMIELGSIHRWLAERKAST
jgi:hypothetical protein